MMNSFTVGKERATSMGQPQAADQCLVTINERIDRVAELVEDTMHVSYRTSTAKMLQAS